MSSVSFQDGDGVKRFVGVVGDGTTAVPYVFLFRFPDGVSIPIVFDANTALKIRDATNAGNQLVIDANGVITAKFVDELAATNPTATAGFIGLFRGLWGSLVQVVQSLGTTSDVSNSTGSLQAKLRFFIADTFGATADAANQFGSMMARVRSVAEALGAQADVASATGSILARLRLLLVDTVGVVADAASATGGLMARLRLIAQSYTSPNYFAKWGVSAGDTISGTPARVTGMCVWNKSNSIRYIQLFNRTTNATAGAVPIFSRVLAPNEKYTLNNLDMGSNDGFVFSTGLAWGFSTTEGTYTAGATTEVSIDLFWRSL